MAELIERARMEIITTGKITVEIAQEIVYNIPLADLPIDIFTAIMDLQYAGLL